MSINRPYRRTCRQFVDSSLGGGHWYTTHPKFAQSPEHYIRAFLLLQKDLQELFDYVEPSDNNLACYSYRIHALLMRACIEVEANCKAILKENEYIKNPKKGKYLDMSDYKMLNYSHRLSSYQVKIPYWNGTANIRAPFSAWENGEALPWYEAYNATKHDRLVGFQSATFEHLLDACCGVLVILSAQFETHDFSPRNTLWALSGVHNDGMESAIGDYFRVKFPDDWPPDLRYDFDWQKLKEEPDPFQTFDYSKIG